MARLKSLNSLPAFPDGKIPARVVIGVIGHRKLDNEIELTEALRSSLETITHMLSPLKNTSWFFYVISALAEGADRLIVKEVMKTPGAVLEVALPLEKADYLADFDTAASRQEFESMLSGALSVKQVSHLKDRPAAYEQVGRYIVDQCDVLIALWDGKSGAGRGGTYETVKYARENSCPLIWINTENASQINFEKGHGIDIRPFHRLDEDNLEKVSDEKIVTQFDHEIDYFTNQAQQAGLPPGKLMSTLKYFLSHYVRGDILALKYQHNYYRVESWGYVLTVAAVVIAAFQELFLPSLHVILLTEVVLMLGVLGIVSLSRRQRWRDKWVDYRFLAERFRSALFIAIAGNDVSALRPPRHMSLSYSPHDWIVIAFLSVWYRRPTLPPPDAASFVAMKKLISDAWVEDQIRYHESTQKSHRGRHERMAMASYVLFGLTIIVVIARVINAGPELGNTIFTFLAVVFPAVAGAIQGMRLHRDYLRKSMRSAEMARHLKELKSKMAAVKDHQGFLWLVKETEETMLHENEDWRIVVRFHTIEVPI